MRDIQRGALGADDVAAYDAARQVALTEVARVTNNPALSGSLPEGARKEVFGLNPEEASFKQILHVAQVLKTDMANRRGSLQNEVQGLQSQLGAKNPAAATTANKPTAPAATQDNSMVGKIRTLRDGRKVKIMGVNPDGTFQTMPAQ
jgi:hypothetical protein